jgi:predicted DNA-binding transcriptional regulator AlpA
MNEAEIILSIKDFEARYGITRSNIYNRINGLKDKGYMMEPAKLGNKSIYRVDQAALMDRLHEHLEAGNTIDSFPDSTGRVQLNQPIDSPTRHPIERLTTQQDSSIDRSPAALGVAALVDAIAGKLAEVIPTPQPDPLANLRLIQEACDQHWLLSSSQLGALLGIHPPSGAGFTRYGFTFTRTGRNGAESAWKISKS